MTNIKPPSLDNQSDFEAAALGVAASLSYLDGTFYPCRRLGLELGHISHPQQPAPWLTLYEVLQLQTCHSASKG